MKAITSIITIYSDNDCDWCVAIMNLHISMFSHRNACLRIYCYYNQFDVKDLYTNFMKKKKIFSMLQIQLEFKVGYGYIKSPYILGQVFDFQISKEFWNFECNMLSDIIISWIFGQKAVSFLFNNKQKTFEFLYIPLFSWKYVVAKVSHTM